MNTAPLLLVPLAAVALLSGKPSTTPATSTESDRAAVAAVLDKPEVRACVAQLQQTGSLLDMPEPAEQTGRHARAQKREIGLHTGHLESSGLSPSDDESFSGARGLSSEEEWEQMFPRYALKRSDAQ